MQILHNAVALPLLVVRRGGNQARTQPVAGAMMPAAAQPARACRKSPVQPGRRRPADVKGFPHRCHPDLLKPVKCPSRRGALLRGRSAAAVANGLNVALPASSAPAPPDSRQRVNASMPRPSYAAAKISARTLSGSTRDAQQDAAAPGPAVSPTPGAARNPNAGVPSSSVSAMIFQPYTSIPSA